jgi:hypothetical protein
MLERAREGSGDPAAIERYAERTYCAPFAEQGWVYEDGTLAIDAYLSVAFPHAGTCTTQTTGGRSRTVPCEQLDRVGPKILDCAALHFVRRAEVQAYLRRLPKHREVRCDDRTPLSELGA